MRITISGSPGSGTTTLGKALADIFGYRYVSAGEFFRACAAERHMSLAEFGELAKKNPEIDKDVDRRQKELGESSDDIILEGRLAGWMVSNADLKILLCASQKCRSQRIAEREGLVPEESYAQTVEREKCEAERYMAYYQIDIADCAPYDLVMSSERFNQDDVLAMARAAVSSLLMKKN
ncbi:MAG: AAA family ATPase [Methanocorpusculum sp.]|nr:AAA family ATPase [Methanocorpusculum sp.]